MLTDTYKAVSSQFSFARVHSYFVKRANLPINYHPISDFSPIWNNRSRSRSSRNLNNRGTYVSLTSRQFCNWRPGKYKLPVSLLRKLFTF